MKIGRHLVSFALGVAVGACLYSLPKLKPLFQTLRWNDSQHVRAIPGKPLPAALAQGPVLAHLAGQVRAPSEKHLRKVTRKAAEERSRVQPKPDIVKIAEPAAAKEVAVVNVSSAPPAPTTFKPMGYVEKAGGQLEAIILQENQVQVVHIGDLISGRYRVTKIAPDSVDAMDETLVQSPMTKPGGTESLGYVQKADGKVEAVVADGDTVRLVPETSAVTMAQAAPRHSPDKSSASATPAEPVTATREAVPDSSVRSGGMAALPPVAAIRQASYEVPPPVSGAADGSALSRLGMGSAAEADGAMNAASRAAAIIVTEKHVGSTDLPAQLPVLMKPLGFVVKADGEFAAILSDDDGVYVVAQGDRFAGRFRAVSVSADAVEAVEDSPWQPYPPPFAEAPAFPDLLSASTQPSVFPFSGEDCSGCKPNELGGVPEKVPDDYSSEAALPPSLNRKDEPVRRKSAKLPRLHSTLALKEPATLPEPATFVFQTLGYVETHDGEMRAIIADGSQVYLVKQGETFADQYRATSVDPTLVLAVRAPPGQGGENFLSAQTESGGKPASKQLFGYLHFPLSGLANVQALNRMGAAGGSVLVDPGVNLLDSSLTGFDLQAHFFTADNPSFTF